MKTTADEAAEKSVKKEKAQAADESKHVKATADDVAEKSVKKDKAQAADAP